MTALAVLARSIMHCFCSIECAFMNCMPCVIGILWGWHHIAQNKLPHDVQTLLQAVETSLPLLLIHVEVHKHDTECCVC